MKIPSMPFKAIALAPFKPGSDLQSEIDFFQVDTTSLDSVMEEMGISLFVPLPDSLCPDGGVEIPIKRMKDFHPDQIIKNTPYLNNLKEAQTFVETSLAKGKKMADIVGRIETWQGLPPIKIEKEPPPKPQKKTSGAIDSILDMVALPDEDTTSVPSKKSGVADQLEQILLDIIGHVFSFEPFIELESKWQGVKLFLKKGGQKADVKLSLVPVSQDTLPDILSSLVTELISDLPSLVLVDIPFDNSPLSLSLLEQIAGFSETLMIPAICWVTKTFLYLDHWDGLKKTPFLPNHMDQAHYAKWQKLEQSTAGNWLSVTCNGILSRYPYGNENPPRTIKFTENKETWMSPVWAISALIGQSISKTGWPTHFTNHHHFVLEDLPLSNTHPEAPISTETFIPNDRMEQFKRVGIMPLAGVIKKDMAFASIDTTVSGSSLGYQLFLSLFTKFIFGCLDTFDKNLDTSDIQENFEKAIVMFLKSTGTAPPGDIHVTAGEMDKEGRIPLKIGFTPSRDVLPLQNKIEMEFYW